MAARRTVVRFILSLSLLVLAAGASTPAAAQTNYSDAVAYHTVTAQHDATSSNAGLVNVAIARPVALPQRALPPQSPQLRPSEITAAYRLPDIYALGVQDHDLDDFTEIIGWRINERWYFGRQDGEDSGLTLVWQDEQDQMSLSKEGIRFTRRF